MCSHRSQPPIRKRPSSLTRPSMRSAASLATDAVPSGPRPATALRGRRRALSWLAGAPLLGAVGSSARIAHAAPAYPTHPIEVIVPSSAGGGTDMLARAFAAAARRHLPAASLVVVNKPGASGAIGMGEVMNARPDGYRIGMLIVELAVLPALKRIRFGSDDFVPVAQLNYDPAAITVRADSPWKTFEQFIAAARDKDRALSVADSGNGSIWHLAAAALADRAGARFTHVPYQGAAPGVVALLGGHVDASAVSPGEVAEHVAAGKLRTLAVMADGRLGGAFAEVPTLGEKGIDLAIGAWRGLGAPKGTPASVVETLADLARKVSEDPEYRDALVRANLGLAYADAAGFRATMSKDEARFRELVERLKLAG